MAQILSLAGATLVLGAFGGLQLGRVQPHNVLYQLANLFGAAMLSASALITQTWGFVMLNVVWAGFAIVKLVQIARGDVPPTPAGRDAAPRP